MSPDLLVSILLSSYALGFAVVMVLKHIRDRLQQRAEALMAYKQTRMRQELVQYVSAQRRQARGVQF